MNIISDSDGHLQVTLTVTIVGQADHAGRVVLREVGGRRGGRVEGDTDMQDGLLSTGPTPSSLSLVYACRGQY